MQALPIFIPELEQLGGTERSMLGLSRWLHQHGLPHYILTYYDHCNLAQYASHPLSIVPLHPAPGARAKIAALRAHFKGRPESSPKLLANGYQPALHCTLAGLRGFHTIMHDTPSLFGDEDARSLMHRLRLAISNKIIGFGLRSGGTTIVNSEFLKSECRKDFDIEAQIVRMGGLPPDTEGRPPAWQTVRHVLPGGHFSMLSVCRIEPNKRLDWLLRSVAALEHGNVAPLSAPLSSLVDWHLDLAGKGSLLVELTALAATLGIADRVHFHGFVSDEDLAGLYSRADLFLMPAVQGYGLPALEAIDRGIPVLLHRESGVSDVLLDTPWAIVCHGEAPQLTPALATAVSSILEGRHHNVPPPQLPTEPQWAQRVSELCHWL